MDDLFVKTLSGTRDILPEEIPQWQWVEERTHRIFPLYGFREIRTPILEATELFARGIGADTDIVGKEMYTFSDQSGRSISLRPEATASVVRAYLQSTMYRGAGLTKLYYIGPMFRYEKKQKGRWRQFYQIGAEVLGSDHPAIEAEAIEMVLLLLASVGVKTRLLINSVGCIGCRPEYVGLLRRELHRNIDSLCEDCRRRSKTNSLRVLDCKVEACQPLISRLPRIDEHLCRACSAHFARFKKHLQDAGIIYEIVPRLVRGLDYYIRTAFEIVSGELGSQNALVGGGRYDGLSEVLGGPPAHGFGFAIGLDRLVMILAHGEGAVQNARPEVSFAYLGDEAFERSLAIARSLRREGIACHLEFGGGSLKSQLRLANKIRARHVIIIGEEELAQDRYVIRRLEDSHQWEATIPELKVYLASPKQHL